MAAAASKKKPVTVAYDEPLDNYERRVKKYLERMGSKDPDGDIAALGDYVARARDADLDPQVVASTVWVKTHEKEAPAPDAFGRRRASAWGAEERPSRPGYYAVDPTGKIIAGPFPERRFATPHADRVSGYIQFEPGEPGVATTLIVAEEPYQVEYAAAKLAAARALDNAGLKYEYLEPLTSLGMGKDWRFGAYGARVASRSGTFHPTWVARVIVERGRTTVQPEGGKPSVFGYGFATPTGAGAADCEHSHPPEVPSRPCGEAGECGCGGTMAAHPPGEAAPGAVLVLVAEEPYERTLHWHRDPKKDQKYFADAGALGRFIVERRTPDRRHGVLPWSLTLGGREIAPSRGKQSGFDSKGEAQGRAARYAKKPEGRAAAEAGAAAAEPPPRTAASECIAVVERNPGCAVPGRVIEDAEDVYDLLGARQKRQGHETYEVLLLNLNNELIGSPVQVASGQRAKVMVDIEQVLAPVVLKEAVKGAEAGCVSFYAVHFHPSGSAHGSPKDLELTKLIERGAKAACPATTFKDHLVIGFREVYSCKKGKIVYRAR